MWWCVTRTYRIGSGAQDATAALERVRQQLELTSEEEKFVLSSIAGTGPFDSYGESFLPRIAREPENFGRFELSVTG